MKIDEKKLLDYTQKISQKIANKNKFGIYDADDITQEIYLLLRQAMPKFDEAKGDEYQFLYHYVCRRLMTLKRDKQVCPKSKNAEIKMKISYPEEIREESKVVDNIHDFLDLYNDFISIVDRKIPASLRLRYLQLLEGVQISTQEKNKVIDAIKSIIRINDISEGNDPNNVKV